MICSQLLVWLFAFWLWFFCIIIHDFVFRYYLYSFRDRWSWGNYNEKYSNPETGITINNQRVSYENSDLIFIVIAFFFFLGLNIYILLSLSKGKKVWDLLWGDHCNKLVLDWLIKDYTWTIVTITSTTMGKFQSMP